MVESEYFKRWNYYRTHDYIVSEFPYNIDFDLTSRCNLECEPCPFHSKKALFECEPQDLDFKLYKKVIDEGAKKGLQAIKFSFSGEPLLYKQLAEAILYAKNKGIMDIRLNSNGLLLTKSFSISLMLCGLTRFILSDYDIPEQIEKGKILQGIKKLFDFDIPILEVKTYNLEKWEGIADEIREHKMFDYHNIEEVREFSEFECEQPWLRILVRANGDILRCSCGTVYFDKIMGNVQFDTIEELWKGKYMDFLRWCHKNHSTELINACVKCPSRNEWIRRNKK